MAVTPLIDIRPFTVAGEGDTEVSVSRGSRKIFATRLTGPCSFDPRPIIGADMEGNSFPVEKYKITVGDVETSLYILHDMADPLSRGCPDPRPGALPRFLMENAHCAAAPGIPVVITVLSDRPARIRVESMLPDGSRLPEETIDIIPENVAFFNHVLVSRMYIPAIQRGVVSLCLEPVDNVQVVRPESGQETATGNTESRATDRIRLYISDREPQANIYFRNRFLATESFLSFGPWEIKAGTTAETAYINGAPVPYDISRERELTVTSHPVDAMQAAVLASMAAADGRVSVDLFSGYRTICAGGAVTKAEIAVAPQGDAMSCLKLSVSLPAPGYMPDEAAATGFDRNRFTDEFTKIFC